MLGNIFHEKRSSVRCAALLLQCELTLHWNHRTFWTDSGSSVDYLNAVISTKMFLFLFLDNLTHKYISNCRIKYSGLYTYYLVLFLVGRQIWRRIGQAESGLRLCLSTLWRLVVLVIIPLSVYVGVFYTHLSMLPKAGPHDSVMTSAFQASLKGGLASITRGQPLHVAHGSQITLRYLSVFIIFTTR